MALDARLIAGQAHLITARQPEWQLFRMGLGSDTRRDGSSIDVSRCFQPPAPSSKSCGAVKLGFLNVFRPAHDGGTPFHPRSAGGVCACHCLLDLFGRNFFGTVQCNLMALVSSSDQTRRQVLHRASRGIAGTPSVTCRTAHLRQRTSAKCHCCLRE
jgi:hypothetical protein